MRRIQPAVSAVLLILLLAAVAVSQEQASQEIPANHGMVEFGVRHVNGDEYGRPDLPFRPSVLTSKFNEYRDIRNGFFIRQGRIDLDNFLGPNHYFDFQTNKTIYRDQSYLATFGAYNKYRLQIRYDEIPHLYSNTTRTLYTQTSPGVLVFPNLLRSTLQGLATSTQLPVNIQTQIVPQEQFFVPQIIRRSGSLDFAYDFSENWNADVYFWREHETGNRPFGQIFNTSPSAALSGGYGVELPEPINYFNNLFRERTEYGRGTWGVQFGYTGSYFENNVGSLTYDNPFRLTDCSNAATPATCSAAVQGPATGRVDLYPNNQAHYLNFAGAFDLTKIFRVAASISPGWLRQNDPLLPYTTNTAIPGIPALPESSAHGQKQTLAMNYTLASRTWNNIQLKASYRQYDYNNDMPTFTNWYSIQGDTGFTGGGRGDNPAYGYNRKNFQVSGNYYFQRKSLLKVGYEGEWMDRTERDVDHSMENSVFATLDLNPNPSFNFRAAYRHSQRRPDQYVDDTAEEISGGITDELAPHRRFDEAARDRDRVDLSASYDLTQKVTVSAFANTTQDNYNLRGGTNSSSPLNFIVGATSPYYLYGVLKDLSYDWGGDLDFTLGPAASFFAEYSHERYHKRMNSRYRVPGGAAPLPLDCSNSARGCDSPNNDWMSTARDLADIFTLGADLYTGRKVTFTTYYSLSAVKGNVNSWALGDPTITTGPNKFLLTGTNAAVPYPEVTNRLHEVTAVLKYKVNNMIVPKIEYRYQQWDNRDYQTSAMTPYMGCVSGLPPSAPLPGCGSPLLGTPSPFYPYFVVGDTSAARYLFLGTDQPSYRTHYIAATVELHF